MKFQKLFTTSILVILVSISTLEASVSKQEACRVMKEGNTISIHISNLLRNFRIDTAKFYEACMFARQKDSEDLHTYVHNYGVTFPPYLDPQA